MGSIEFTLRDPPEDCELKRAGDGIVGRQGHRGICFQLMRVPEGNALDAPLCFRQPV